MAAAMASKDDLERAFDHAIAIAKEWEGAPLGDKLAQFGLSVEDVREVLAERWETYRHQYDPGEPEVIFVQAMLEGLLAGTKLRRESEDA